MKVSLNWLNEYVKINLSAQELSHRLTMAGLEVESIDTVKGDKVFELEITPNRADCLSIIGLAREVSAMLNKSLKVPTIKKTPQVKNKISITIEDKKACLQYVGFLVENITVGKTPTGMSNHLSSLGLRSINNIVDITNFCLMELGQPLHAFDYDKLSGGKIIVRRAKKGESIVTLDDVERKLDPSILVIADAKRPVAIAGVMGGKDSQVTSQTKNILLESAYFDPILIRHTSRKLALSSDSSYRFERGVDQQNVLPTANRALALILENAKGKMVSFSDARVSKKKALQKNVSITLDQINSYLGAQISSAKIKSILTKLDFKLKETKKNSYQITPPSFRPDIKQEVDIIEEIARIIGYDQLPEALPLINATNMKENVRRQKRNLLKRTLVGQGLKEIITFAMVNQSMLDKSNYDGIKGIEVCNPITQDHAMMRPSLFSSMMSVVQTNINKGQRKLSFFETGKTYTKNKEEEVLCLLISEETNSDWRDQKRGYRNYFDLTGKINEIFDCLSLQGVTYEVKNYRNLEEGQSAQINWDGKSIGFVGKVAGEVLNNWGIKAGRFYCAEINVENILSRSLKEKSFVPLCEYPAVSRDVSIAVNKDVSFDKVKAVVVKNGTKLLSNFRFVEEYLGEKIENDKRGLMFSVTYQSSNKTLREEDVNVIHEKVLKALVVDLDVIIR